MPDVMLRYSDDGGNTWSNTKYRDIGDIGQYGRRVAFTRMGQFIARVIEVSVSDAVKRDIIAASVDLEGEAR
jgi:Neuraminidase (sialidase)